MPTFRYPFPICEHAHCTFKSTWEYTYDVFDIGLLSFLLKSIGFLKLQNEVFFVQYFRVDVSCNQQDLRVWQNANITEFNSYHVGL